MIDQVTNQPSVKKDFREYPMLVGFFYWWLRDTPSLILHTGEKIVAYVYSYFSIPILLKTLFDPWKKDEIDTSNMAIDDKVKVLIMNLVSRLVGAAVRSITIFVGLLFIIFTMLAVAVGILGFILLPFISLALIIKSIAGL